MLMHFGKKKTQLKLQIKLYQGSCGYNVAYQHRGVNVCVKMWMIESSVVVAIWGPLGLIKRHTSVGHLPFYTFNVIKCFFL